MSEKTDKMLEEIDSLTVVELAELVKGIEEKYGVTAAAVAAPAAGGAAEGGAAEKSEFDVVLTETATTSFAQYGGMSSSADNAAKVAKALDTYLENAIEDGCIVLQNNKVVSNNIDKLDKTINPSVIAPE